MTLRHCNLVCLLVLLNGCGGGSGNGQAAANVSTNTGSAVNQALPLSWNLERKRANELDTTSANVDAVLDHIFTDRATQAVVISKRGYVIGERYADGYDNNSLGTSWSVAKSFYSALMGIAVEEGWIQSTQQRASEFLTEWSDSDKADITIAQILSMRSGYDGNDQVFFQNDQTAYAINLPLTSTPGTRFAYSNANSQLMEPLLRRATGVSAHDYLQSKLLQPLGIENAGLWLDATAQQPMTYCCIDLKPDDFLKFGLLYARDGQWDGTQIVPASYVQKSFDAHSPSYGYQWWLLNEAYFGSQVPITIYAALGLNGQKIYLWPAADIVVVVLTQYQHSANQGYVLDLSDEGTNFPNTCSARNSCPGSTGSPVPTFDQLQLVKLIDNLN